MPLWFMTEFTAKQPRQYHPPALRLLCRKQYVRGEVGSLAQLAKRHGISGYTIRDWAEADDWPSQRQHWLQKQYQSEEYPEAPASNPPPATQLPLSTGDLSALMLARAQTYENHLTQLRTQLMDETDPAKIDRLASAIAKLEDVFQVYSNIPRPGSRKPPPAPPAPKPTVYALPIDDTDEQPT